MNPLCIYHANCSDGFAAATVVSSFFNGDVELFPGVYGKPPPNIKNRDVIMVDFSYKRPVIDIIANECSTLLILDHHKTAQADLDGFPPPVLYSYNPSAMLDYQRFNNAPIAVHALFDMDRSGAGIAWDYFFANKPRPLFIDYIEDRDLWRKALPGGDEFTIALRSYPQEFELWRGFLWIDPKVFIDEGRSIQRYYRLRVEELKRSAYKAQMGADMITWHIGVANAPYFAASEVAGELATDDVDFGACYFEARPGEWQYSLRSRGDFDVSEVAKHFGGGGHRNAAGFTVPRPVHEALP